MSNFTEFWMEKARLDDLACKTGKSAAALIDIFPYLESMLDRWDALPNEQKRVESSNLSEDQRQFLLDSARAMSVLAVRTNRKEHLRYGLLAFLLEGGQFDKQETVSYLSLLNHSATKIGVNLMTIYSAL